MNYLLTLWSYFQPACQRGTQKKMLKIIQTLFARDSGSDFGCLYRSGPSPLAADATEVERPHLHLHKWDGELVALPVVPVDTL